MKKLCFVESLTGGMMSSKIVSIPGSSNFFKGSIVAYSKEIKEKLGIDTSKGVVNKDVALQMSKMGREYFDADICVSFTGNAGPTTLDDKDVGLVYIAINEEVFELKFEGNREQIREKCVNYVYEKLKFFFPI